MFNLCVLGQMVYSVRRRCGQQLAIEAPVEADMVSTVPESATPAALGYAEKVMIWSLHFSSPSLYQNICANFLLQLSSVAFSMLKYCAKIAMLDVPSFSQT